MAGFYSTLVAEYGHCPAGCTLCEDVCISTKADSKGSRIKPVHLPEVDFHGVVKCNQCSEPACLEACPTGAITKSNVDGIVRINEDKCVGCGMCTLCCPYGGIYYDISAKKSLKCDNCDGDPQCVESCKYAVLDFAQGKRVFGYFSESPQKSQGIMTCQGCGHELATRLAFRVLGQDIIVFGGPGCSLATFMNLSSLGGAVTVPSMACFMVW